MTITINNDGCGGEWWIKRLSPDKYFLEANSLSLADWEGFRQYESLSKPSIHDGPVCESAWTPHQSGLRISLYPAFVKPVAHSKLRIKSGPAGVRWFDQSSCHIFIYSCHFYSPSRPACNVQNLHDQIQGELNSSALVRHSYLSIKNPSEVLCICCFIYSAPVTAAGMEICRSFLALLNSTFSDLRQISRAVWHNRWPGGTRIEFPPI